MPFIAPVFVTKIYEGSLAEEPGFSAFNAELLRACRTLAASDEAGRVWSRENGFGGYTSYGSIGVLSARDPVFERLRTKLDRHAAAFAETLEFDLPPQVHLALDHIWVNVLRPGAAHAGHLHPNSVLSGTMYVSTPPGASALKLEDPRLPLMMAAPPRRPDASDTARTFVYLTPREGTVFLWESWLRHGVPANAAKAARISISFNYSYHRDLGVGA